MKIYSYLIENNKNDSIFLTYYSRLKFLHSDSSAPRPSPLGGLFLNIQWIVHCSPKVLAYSLCTVFMTGDIILSDYSIQYSNTQCSYYSANSHYCTVGIRYSIE